MRFEIACERHVKLIFAGMRERDVSEIERGWGKSCIEAMHEALEESFYARTLFVGLEPLAIYGLAPLSMLAGQARIWIFGTRAIDRHPMAFCRASKLALTELLCHCSVMTNIVDANDAQALKWLRWLGGTLTDRTFPKAGYTFVQFVLSEERSCLRA